MSKASAIALFVIGNVAILLGVEVEDEDRLGAVVFYGIGLACWLAALFVNFRRRQVAAQVLNTGPASPLKDSRPDVLYLRSFRADASMAKRLGLSTEEEDLAEAVRPFGDLIAIGRPGERLPLPGAARTYFTNDEWQTQVLERMSQAPLVILRAGESDGLLWECRQAFTTLPPKRVVILVLDLKAAEYERFTADVWKTVRITLPSISRFSLTKQMIDGRGVRLSNVTPGFIKFSAGWRADFVPLELTIVKKPFHTNLAHPFRQALQSVFAANDIAV
jgi:hypothetical protein